MIPASNFSSEEALKSIPTRMNVDDIEPELFGAPDEAKRVVSAPPTQEQLVELQTRLTCHARRLRDLERRLHQQDYQPRREVNGLQSGGAVSGSFRSDRDRFDSSNIEEAASLVHSARNSQCAAAPGVKDDPYTRMFASAQFNPARIFDQDLLMAIYDKPYQRMRNQAALITSGLFGLLSMPFGPIGMVGGAMVGALIGTVVGAVADMRIIKARLEDSQLEKKRLKSLIRWASERHNEDDEILKLIEMVTLEFKPIADIASGSKSARKLLKLLDQWIAHKSVTRQLWVYMERLLQRWRELSRDQLLRSMMVLQTLTIMYRYSSRALDDLEVQFIRRMERLLAHESVKSVMAHAQSHATQGELNVMESMVYADAVQQNWTPTKGPILPMERRINKSPPPSMHEEVNEEGEAGSGSDSDDGTDNFTRPTSPMRKSATCSPTATLGRIGISPHGSAEALIVADRTAGGSPRSAGAAASAGASTPGRKLAPKKPFFRNWQDFMDFDDTIKHKMPITLCEFDLLLQKEQEDFTGWDIAIERKELKVAKTLLNSGTIFIRTWATFPGVELHAAFYLFYNLEERTKWDKTFCKMAVIESGMHGSDIVYCLMKIATVTPRDFLQYRRVRTMEDGSILIVLRSAEHPDMPEDRNFIRVENKISGYVLRQDWEGDKPVLKMFLMTCSDVKGMIPKWMINYLAPKKSGEWMAALKGAATEYQKTHPGCKGEVLSILQRCTAETHFDFEPEVDKPSFPPEISEPPPRQSDTPSEHTAGSGSSVQL